MQLSRLAPPFRLLLPLLPLLLSPPGPAVAAAAPPARIEPLDHAVCRLIANAAIADHLPVGFLTRVIWRESSFRAGVVSPAGAQGIAQFMPQTAQARGLADPFDPEQAIPKAARLLADLRRRFGTLGIAAAAYNAGPARVAQWLQGQSELPPVTRAYVRFVVHDSGDENAAPGGETSGEAAAGLAGSSTRPGSGAASPTEDCLAVAADLRHGQGGGDGEQLGFTPLAPWGVQLAGNFAKAAALAAFERERRRYAAALGPAIGAAHPMIIGRLLRSRGTRPFYQVRLPAASRAEADALCRRIQSVGGACIAMPS